MRNISVEMAEIIAGWLSQAPHAQLDPPAPLDDI